MSGDVKGKAREGVLRRGVVRIARKRGARFSARSFRRARLADLEGIEWRWWVGMRAALWLHFGGDFHSEITKKWTDFYHSRYVNESIKSPLIPTQAS